MTSLILLMCDTTQELKEYTEQAIYSLNGIADEFIIVDNASDYGGGLARSVADIYIRNMKNAGYPKSVNQGFHVSKGEFIAIANNDVRVSPNWLEVAQEIFQKDSKVGTVHFKMIPYEEEFNLGDKTWITGKERWCHASFFVIRRESIPEGGYFEGYSEGGYDDYDLFHRMRDLNGWKQAYTNKAQFQHADSATYKTLDAQNGDRALRDFNNRELYKKRHGEYPDIQFANLFPEQMKTQWRPFP